MPQFTESSITLDFPDDNHFRFANCRGYQELSGFSFKEMDAGWFDVQENICWLFELKDYSIANIDDQNSIDKRVLDLLKKSVDSLSMMLSAKHQYTHGQTKISPCFPENFPNETTVFKFINIIHCDPSQKAAVPLINERYRNRFKPYAMLFGINTYSVIEHSSAAVHIEYVL